MLFSQASRHRMEYGVEEKKAEKVLDINKTGHSTPDEKDVLGRGDGEPFELTRDGVRLHPQPTADPLDPLNWSKMRKNSILAIVMWM